MKTVPDELSIQMVSGLKVHTPANGALKFKSRRSHAVVMYLNGKCNYLYPEQNISFLAQQGSVVFLPEANNYAIEPEGDSDCICINFHCPEMMNVTPFCLCLDDSAHAQMLFEKCITTWTNHEIGWKFECTAYLYRIFAELQKNTECDRAKRHTILELRKAYEYIHEHYRMQDLSIAEIAKMCNMSERSFRTKFKFAYNMPPMQYITNLRLSYAEELLQNFPHLTVTDIASACGYSDVFYFSRLFKQYYHVSPSHYPKITS